MSHTGGVVSEPARLLVGQGPPYGNGTSERERSITQGRAVKSPPRQGTPMIRTIHAVSLALLVSSAHALAAEPADFVSTGDATAPVVVKVVSLDVVDVGATKGDPSASFGMVNLKRGACYAFAPPGGPTIEVGGSYTVIPASNVDDALRAKLKADYPKCAIVDVVGRSVR